MKTVFKNKMLKNRSDVPCKGNFVWLFG